MLAMHIIAHFFPIFLKFPKKRVMTKSITGEEEEVDMEARAEGGVEVDEER